MQKGVHPDQGGQPTEKVFLTSNLGLHVLAWSCESQVALRVLGGLVVVLGESLVDLVVAGVRTIAGLSSSTDFSSVVIMTPLGLAVKYIHFQNHIQLDPQSGAFTAPLRMFLFKLSTPQDPVFHGPHFLATGY